MRVRRALTVVACVAVVAAGCGSGDSNADELDQLRTQVAKLEAENEELRAAGTAAADEPEDTADEEATTVPPVEATTTQASVVDGVEATCAYIGTNFLGNMEVELIFANTLGDIPMLEVTYALIDADRIRFSTGTEPLLFARANEQFRISASTIDEVPSNIEEATIGCTVLAIEEGNNIGGFQRVTDADTCTVLGPDSSGDIQAEVAVTSPFDATTEVQIWWALQVPGPVRFDTGTEVVDLVAAGELIRINEDVLTDIPGWIGDSEITCAVLGLWDR